MRLDIDVPALITQHGEVGNGGFGAGQQDQVGLGGDRAAGLDNVDGDVRLGGQRVEVVEIGDARQARHGDAHGPVGAAGPLVQRHRVFRRQRSRTREPWDDAVADHAGAPGHDIDGGRKQRLVAPEFVDQIAAQQGAFGRVDQHMGAGEAGQHAAAVDIGDQDDGHAGLQRETHIGNVALADIDLGGAACALRPG